MNQKVVDAYIERSNKVKGKLLRLSLEVMDLVLEIDESDESNMKKFDKLSSEIEKLTNYLREKLAAVREEIETIEQTRKLTAQEEQKYIDQMSDILTDGEQKTEKVEELFNQIIKDIENA